MKNLIPISYENQRIMTTSVIAESYETTEKVISNNFNRNKDKYKKGKHYFLLQGEELAEFLQSSNLGIQNPSKIRSLYLWTEKGALLQAKSLNTDKAWEVYDMLVENYFRPQGQVIKKLSPLEQLKLQNEAILEVNGKVDELGERISAVENSMTIDYGQQLDLNELAKKKVVSILGGKDAPAYKELNKKAFSSIWKDYKRIMNVNSYKNTAVKDLDMARKVIIDWKPNRELELMIKGCNSQIRM